MAGSCQTLLCDICANRGQTTVATGYCSECREIYCCQCTKHHREAEDTQTHKCVIFDSTQGESDQVECENCKEGVNENIRVTYLCCKCRQLYCKPCKQLHSISKATSDHDLFEINLALPKSKVRMKSVLFTSENVTHFDKSVFDSGLVPKQLVQRDSVECTSDFEKFTLSDTNVSDSSCASYQDQIDRVNSSDYERFNVDLGILISVFQTSNGQLKIGLRKECLDKLSAKITGTFSAKVTQIFKSTSMKSLLNSSRKMEHDQHDCWFCGIICLNDGRLILLDMANEKLKMFDINYKMISIEPTKGKGRGMTKISDVEIAVVVYDTVYFYTVTKNKFKLNKNQNIKLGSIGFGISYNKGMLAVFCDICNSMIKIYSKTGEELSEISLQQYKTGHIMNLDSEEDRIYLSSSPFGRSTFTCISQNEELLWKFDFDGQDVVKFYDSVLVADYSGAIVLCTNDGQFSKAIIQDREHLSGAQYMDYNPETQRLYITQYRGDYITIIQLQSNLS